MVRATVQVILLCLAVYALQLGVRLVEGVTTMRAMFALARPYEVAPWTFVTSVYAHGSEVHLVSNLVMLALVGIVVERQTTIGRFHAFVLVTGIASGIAQTLIPSLFGVNAAVLGISGAVFALLGYVLTGNRLSDTLLDRLHLSPLVYLVLFVAISIVVTWYTASPNAALIGHFTGFLLGLLAGASNLLRVGGTAETAEAAA